MKVWTPRTISPHRAWRVRSAAKAATSLDSGLTELDSGAASPIS